MTLRMLIRSALRLPNCVSQTLFHLLGHVSPRNRKRNSAQSSVTLISLCSLHTYVGSLQGSEQGESRAPLPVVCKPACGKHASRREQSRGGPVNSHSEPGTKRCPKPFTRLGIFSLNSYSPCEPACVFFSVVFPPL